MTIEYKNFTVDLQKGFKAAEKGEGSAVIAQLNVIDLDGDVTIPGAFGKQDVNLLPAHDRMAPRLGKGVLTEEDNLAIASFKFNLDEDAKTAREWYSALKFDMANGEPLQEWSYGFKVVDSEFGEFQGQQVRFLKTLEVHEISPVLRGAGLGTGTLAIKSEKMTFKEQTEKAIMSLDDVVAFIERSKSLADLKAKDGKSLSADKVEVLKSFESLLEKALNDSKAVIDSMGNDVVSGDALQSLVKYQKTLHTFKHLLKTG
jgi:phage head maturation protease